jgi:hypothetical protein
MMQNMHSGQGQQEQGQQQWGSMGGGMGGNNAMAGYGQVRLLTSFLDF